MFSKNETSTRKVSLEFRKYTIVIRRVFWYLKKFPFHIKSSNIYRVETKIIYNNSWIFVSKYANEY